jgi:plasmid stabilization system protein ParE
VSLPLRIRAEATAELNEAWNWYEERREGLGDELLGCVEGALAAIQRSPRAYRRVEGRIRQAVVRRFPYVVLFVDYPEYVEVLAVFHTSRDPKQWQGRMGS